ACDSRSGAVRRGPPGEARVPGAPDRSERRARLAGARAPGRCGDPAPDRPPRGHLLPLTRGPDRQALPAFAGARVYVPARLSALLLRLNIQLDKATQQRSRLRAENATLQSELSSRLASPRIQALARGQDGLVPADPSTIGYLTLGR